MVLGVGGGPGVAEDARYGSRRWGEALIRRVGGWGGDADDGSSEVLLAAVQLQVSRLSVQTGATEDTNTNTPFRSSSNRTKVSLTPDRSSRLTL